MDSASSPPIDEHLRGVGGWLIFLILGLAFVMPFWQIRIAFHAFETLLSSKPLTQAAILRLSVIVAVYAGLAVFSVVSGISLWSNNRRAPGITKAYLVVSILAVGILYSGYRVAGFEVDLPRILFNRGVYGCFWYAYLARSRRVRLTYSDRGVIPAPYPSSPGVA
jgi:uncharacterized protein DUF2569